MTKLLILIENFAPLRGSPGLILGNIYLQRRWGNTGTDFLARRQCPNLISVQEIIIYLDNTLNNMV